LLQASRRLGYRPNPLARGLRGASTNLIGAVVRDFSDPFFAGAIEALVVESMAHGYNVVLGHVHGRLDEAIPLTSVIAFFDFPGLAVGPYAEVLGGLHHRRSASPRTAGGSSSTV
jgi:hypothetical protein